MVFKRKIGMYSMLYWLCLTLSLLDESLASWHGGEPSTKHQCEPIVVELCRGLGYNVTRMPNMLGQESQDAAGENLQNFSPLIKVQCSSQLQFFLCSSHLPLCTEKVDQQIGPCRPLCETVKRRCEPILRRFGYSWPPALACDKFPEQNDGQSMCMEGPGESPETDGSGGMPVPLEDDPFGTIETLDSTKPEQDPVTRKFRFPVVPSSSEKLCRHKFDYRYFVYINASRQCAAICNDHLTILFSKRSRDVAAIWLSCSSGLCLILSTAALICVIMSSHRYLYPEKSIVFIVLCGGLSCIGYLIRLFSGASATGCAPYIPFKGADPYEVWVTDGLQNVRCTLVFIFTYFFGMAASVWWVIFALTWLLAAGLDWGQESLERRTTLYHISAWVIPALLTIIVLVYQFVDADELTGLCSVGFQDSKELLRFVILPHVIYLVIGMILLTVGFGSALCCCQSNRGAGVEKGTISRHLDSHLLKLGVLAAFYVVPGSCAVAAHFYEYSYRAEWLKNRIEPSFETFILKILATMLFGLLCASWIIGRYIFARLKNKQQGYPAQKSLAHVVRFSGYQQNTLCVQQQQSRTLLYSEFNAPQPQIQQHGDYFVT